MAVGCVGHNLGLRIERELSVKNCRCVDVYLRAKAGHDQGHVLPQLLNGAERAGLVQRVIELGHVSSVIAKVKADHRPRFMQRAAVVTDEVHHRVCILWAHEVRCGGRIPRVLVHDLILVACAGMLSDPHREREGAIGRIVEVLDSQIVTPSAELHASRLRKRGRSLDRDLLRRVRVIQLVHNKVCPEH